MELTDYNIMFVHIKGKNNVLADAFSRLKTLNIYQEPLENPKRPVVSNMQGHVMETCNSHAHQSPTMLHTEQMQTCKRNSATIMPSNKSSFKSVLMSANSILQKHKYIPGLKHDITITPCSLVPTIQHEFHDFKGDQETIHMFKTIRISYWWSKLWWDNVEYIVKYSMGAKNYPTWQGINNNI